MISPAPGQTWVPTKSGGKAKARTITSLGPHRCWPNSGDCVFFSVPGEPEPATPRVLNMKAWLSWVRKNEAVLDGDEIAPLTEAEMAWCRSNPRAVRRLMNEVA